MNKLKLTFAYIILLSFCLTSSSCGNKSKDKAGSSLEVTDTSGIEYTSSYICPMHCEGSGGESAGTCPVCKMDYVVNKNKNKTHDHKHDHDGHDHDHSHEGHSH